MSNYLEHIQNVRKKFLEILPLSTDIETQEKNYDRLFMLLTLAGLPDDLDFFRQEMLTGASILSMDDVFARLLRVSQPVVSISDCSFKLNGKTANVAQTNSFAPSLETPKSLANGSQTLANGLGQIRLLPPHP
ncbi:hypothetical protein SESBI_22486 [Sesbania bispinosa]|nr:hypothetical protein SESBI_22486 [Sesbania bispinosa]